MRNFKPSELSTMFIFDNLTLRQIEITLLKDKVNTFLKALTKILSDRHYNALFCKSKLKIVDSYF